KLLRTPAVFMFVFDGPHQPPTKRGVKIRTNQLGWVEPTKAIICAFGFLVHQAPGEAEAELALLNRWGSVDAVLTKDGDALVFGATTVIKTKNTDNICEYRAVDLESIGLPRSRLFFYALTAGGDY
ncbi:PIN domain-like protein, partial [Coprinellus micaceus]